jgi:hypothetical protein
MSDRRQRIDFAAVSAAAMRALPQLPLRWACEELFGAP